METTIPVTDQRRLAMVRSYVREIEALGSHWGGSDDPVAVERLVAKYGRMRAAVCALNEPELAQEQRRLAAGVMEVLAMYKACCTKPRGGDDSGATADRVPLCKALLEVLNVCARECGDEARVISDILFMLLATAPPEARFGREFAGAFVAKIEMAAAAAPVAKHMSLMLALCVTMLLSRNPETAVNSSNVIVRFSRDLYCNTTGIVDLEDCRESAIEVFEALRSAVAEDPFLSDEKGGVLPALVVDTLDAMFTKYTNDLGVSGLKAVYFYTNDNESTTNTDNENISDDDNDDSDEEMESFTTTATATAGSSDSAEMKRLAALLRFASALYKRQRYERRAGFFEDRRRASFCDFLYFLLSRKQDDNDPTFEKDCFWGDLFACLASIISRPKQSACCGSNNANSENENSCAGPVFLGGYLDFARVLCDPRVVGEPRNAPMLRALLALLGATGRATLDLLRALAGPGVLLHPAVDSAVKAEALRILRRQGCFCVPAAQPFFDALFEAEARAQSYGLTCQLLKFLAAGPAAASVVGCEGIHALALRINPVSYTARASKLRLFRLSLDLAAATVTAAAATASAGSCCERVHSSICRNERMGYVIVDVLRSAAAAPGRSVEFMKCALSALRLAEAIVRAGYGTERHMREALAHDVLLPLLRLSALPAGRAARVQGEINFAVAKVLKLEITALSAPSAEGPVSAEVPWGTPAALAAVLGEAHKVLSTAAITVATADPRLVNEVVKLVVRACARAQGTLCAELRGRILDAVVGILEAQDGAADAAAAAPLTKNALRLVLLELRNGVPARIGEEFAARLAKFDAAAPFKTAVLLLNTALICDALRGEAGVQRTTALFERTLGALPSAGAAPKYLENLAGLVLFMLEVSGSRRVPCDPRITLALLAHATRILGEAPALRRFCLGMLHSILAYVHNNRKVAARAGAGAERYLASFEEELALINTLFRTLSGILLEKEEEGVNKGKGGISAPLDDDVLRVLLWILKLNKAYYLNEEYAARNFAFFSAAVLRSKSDVFRSAAATLAALVPRAVSVLSESESEPESESGARAESLSASHALLVKALRILFALLAECPEARPYDIPGFEQFVAVVLERYLKCAKAILVMNNSGDEESTGESEGSSAAAFDALGKLLLAVAGLAARAPPSFAASLLQVLAGVLSAAPVMEREKALAKYYYVNEGDDNIYEDPAAYAHNTTLAGVVAVAAAVTAQCARDAQLLAACHSALLRGGAAPFFCSVLATQPEIAAASVARLELVRDVAELCADVIAGDAITPAADPRCCDAYAPGLTALLATLAENRVFWPTERALANPGAYLHAAQVAFFLSKALLGLYRNTAKLCVPADSMPALAAFLTAAARAFAVWNGSGASGDGVVKVLERAAMNTVEGALYLLVHHVRFLHMKESAKRELLASLRKADASGSLLDLLKGMAPKSEFDTFSRMVQYLEDPAAF